MKSDMDLLRDLLDELSDYYAKAFSKKSKTLAYFDDEQILIKIRKLLCTGDITIKGFLSLAEQYPGLDLYLPDLLEPKV